MERIVQESSLQSLLLKMQFNGQLLSTGTGFVVNTASGYVLVTNRHNVTGRNQETGKCLSSMGAEPNEIVIVHNKIANPLMPQNALGGWIERIERLYDDENNPRWREHPSLKEKADFVALPLSQLDDVRCLPYDMYNLGPDLALAPTETVSVIGFPFGKTAGEHFAIWATGFIASEPTVNYKDLPILLIDCRSRQGQSGSPVIAFRNDGVLKSGRDLKVYNGPVRRFVGIYIAEEFLLSQILEWFGRQMRYAN